MRLDGASRLHRTRQPIPRELYRPIAMTDLPSGPKGPLAPLRTGGLCSLPRLRSPIRQRSPQLCSLPEELEVLPVEFGVGDVDFDPPSGDECGYEDEL